MCDGKNLDGGMLPIDVVCQIFIQLHITDLAHFARTSKLRNRLMHKKRLMLKMVQRDFPGQTTRFQRDIDRANGVKGYRDLWERRISRLFGRARVIFVPFEIFEGAVYRLLHQGLIDAATVSYIFTTDRMNDDVTEVLLSEMRPFIELQKPKDGDLIRVGNMKRSTYTDHGKFIWSVNKESPNGKICLLSDRRQITAMDSQVTIGPNWWRNEIERALEFHIDTQPYLDEMKRNLIVQGYLSGERIVYRFRTTFLHVCGVRMEVCGECFGECTVDDIHSAFEQGQFKSQASDQEQSQAVWNRLYIQAWAFGGKWDAAQQ